MAFAVVGAKKGRVLLVSLLGCSISIAVFIGAGGCASTQEEAPQPVPVTTAPQSFSYADWQTFLGAVVTPDGYVRWDMVQNDQDGVRTALLRFIGLVNAVSPQNHPELFQTENDQLAYWINAYNAMAIFAVIEHNYPGRIIADDLSGSVLKEEKFTFGQGLTTLDNLSGWAFGNKADARIYFALNFCATSCPPLRVEPYDGAVLEAQLVDQGQRYLSDPRAVVRNGDTAELNDLLYSMRKQAFEAQFQKLIGRPPGSILEALQPFALGDSPLVGATKTGQLGFDWSLNRPPR
jgi:Protein of unknown function, DUF547